MIRRSITAVGALAVLLLSAGTAHAAPTFGTESGEFILSADRLMPLFAYENVKTDNGGGGSSSTTLTSIALVTHGAGVSAYNIPRFALDVTVIPHLTVGGSVYAYFQLGSSDTGTNAQGVSVTTQNAKATFFGIAPRVGYILPIGDTFAFWPRGGLSFNDVGVSTPTVTNPAGKVTDGGSATVTQWAIDLEPTFVFTPIPHVGITGAAVVDIPFAGSRSVTDPVNGTTVSVSSTQFHFGLNLGLLIWF